MLFPKFEVNFWNSRPFASLFDVSRCDVWPAKVDTHLCCQTSIKGTNVRLVQNAISHSFEKFVKVRSTKIRPAIELCEWIFLHANRIQDNVICSIDIQALSQVGMDTQKLGSCMTWGVYIGKRLSFD